MEFMRPLNSEKLAMRQQAADASDVRRMHERVVAQVAFPLGALLGQDVILVPLRALEIAGAGLGKALGGATVRLLFRHGALTPLNSLRGRAAGDTLQFISRFSGLRHPARTRHYLLRAQH